MMAPEYDPTAPEDFLPVEADTAVPSSPWRALGWLVFLVAAACSPAVVWAVWTWSL